MNTALPHHSMNAYSNVVGGGGEVDSTGATYAPHTAVGVLKLIPMRKLLLHGRPTHK